MHSEEFVFAGSDGSPLSARLTLPSGPVRASAVFSHCFTCSKDIPAAKRIVSALAHRGLAVLSFDFTGLGHSEGEFANTNFSSNVGDLLLAAQALGERHSPPSLLVGHSLGGAAVLRAAPSLPSVVAVATLGAPSDPSHVTHLFSESLEDIAREGEATVDLGGRPFTIRQQFLEDISATSLEESLRNLGAALLVMHSPVDQIVGVENAAEIFRGARHPKSYISLDDADHLMRRVQDAEYAASVIASWADRYLPASVPTTSEEAPDGSVVVSEVAPDGFTQDILVGGKHALVADEPLDIGGRDLGPTPYQFVSMGLGACTSMTMRLYARRKKIALTHVSVVVTHDKRHAVECEACETKAPLQDHFHRSISMEGDLTPEDVDALLRIADKCPVHRTLEAVSHISTTHEQIGNP